MSMPTKSIVIGTAGHIDHGKTALVRALTGVDTDRLPEEKRRGITIDLGFASLDALAPDNSPLRISFVDVPGHKLFIRNMLAGAGCIDAVLLVVSAEEGIKPQTEEHLSICNLLGVRRGLTVITKIDSVDAAQLESVRSETNSFLRGTFLEGGIFPVSARTSAGMEALRRELLSLAMQPVTGDQDHVSRLPIDRSFVMKGFGTVVTGTLLSGAIQVGDALSLEPGIRAVRVRGLQTHGHPEEVVQSGSRVALNLAGIDVSLSRVHRRHPCDRFTLRLSACRGWHTPVDAVETPFSTNTRARRPVRVAAVFAGLHYWRRGRDRLSSAC